MKYVGVALLALWIGLSESLSNIANSLTQSPRDAGSRYPTIRNDESNEFCSSDPYRVAVIGGGASGMFAAALLANNTQSPPFGIVSVYEATGEVLRSIRISAGGRQNVLFDPMKLKARELINKGYPRRKKEIISVLSKHFSPIEQQGWFEERGVQFQREIDGRLVVDSDDSPTISDVILGEVKRAGVKVNTNVSISAVSKLGERFVVSKKNRPNGSVATELFDSIILATGNSCSGLSIARSLNHTIQKPYRSCFGFKSSSSQSKYKVPLSTLPIGSRKIHKVRLTYKMNVPGQKRPRQFKQEGPIEISIRGESVSMIGMAALNLASFSAPELKQSNYSGKLLIHFCPQIGQVERVEKLLWDRRQDQKYSHRKVTDECPLVDEEIDYENYDFETGTFARIVTECIPKDIWTILCLNSGATLDYKWSQMSPKKIRALADLTVGFEFAFKGKYTLEDEFVNAGGVALDEVDLSTMESKIVDGLFFCGQVLDGDGAHGGFTFMRDFGTSFIASQTISRMTIDCESPHKD